MPLNIAVVTSQLCSTEQKNQIPILVDLSRLSIRNPDSASTGGNQKWLNIKICDILNSKSQIRIGFRVLNDSKLLKRSTINVPSTELKARRSSNIRIEVVLIETVLVFDSRWLIWKKHSGQKTGFCFEKKKFATYFFSDSKEK